MRTIFFAHLISLDLMTVIMFGEVAIQLVTGDSFSGVKWPEREADHSPRSVAKVKNTWSYTSIPYTSSRRGT
jgi:hypothetical protein